MSGGSDQVGVVHPETTAQPAAAASASSGSSLVGEVHSEQPASASKEGGSGSNGGSGALSKPASVAPGTSTGSTSSTTSSTTLRSWPSSSGTTQAAGGGSGAGGSGGGSGSWTAPVATAAPLVVPVTTPLPVTRPPVIDSGGSSSSIFSVGYVLSGMLIAVVIYAIHKFLSGRSRKGYTNVNDGWQGVDSMDADDEFGLGDQELARRTPAAAKPSKPTPGVIGKQASTEMNFTFGNEDDLDDFFAASPPAQGGTPDQPADSLL